MVKLFCLLFLSFILLLSARPCCAGDDCNEQSISVSAKTTQQPQKEKDCRGCSPFFSCGSCTGVAMVYPVYPAPIKPIEAPLLRSYPPYLSADVLNTAQSIWQPPQLS